MANLQRFTGTVPGMTDAADISAVSNAILDVDANAMKFGQGLLANRPAAGIAGRVYWATDVNGGTEYYDTGSAWRSSALAEGTVMAASLANIQSFSASATITASGSSNVRFTGATTGQVLTLPAAVSGLEFTVINRGSVPVTVSRSGADTIGAVTMISLAPGAKLLVIGNGAGAWIPIWDVGEQVARGYQQIVANATPPAGGTFLAINVTGDGVTPVKLVVHVCSLNAATDVRLFAGTTQVQTFQTGTTGASYEHVIPAFSGAVEISARLGASTTVVADTTKPAYLRATWAPGNYTANP